MSRTRKFTIYKSLGMLDLFEQAQLEKDVKENLLGNGYKEEDITNELIQEETYRDDEFNFTCEQDNLNKELTGRVLCFGKLGRWDSKKSAYKVMGRNLNEVLNSAGCDEFTIYSDGYNIRVNGYHHDGSNSFTFREIREDRNIDKFLNMIYNDEPITNSMINYYTKSLNNRVASIYGIR